MELNVEMELLKVMRSAIVVEREVVETIHAAIQRRVDSKVELFVTTRTKLAAPAASSLL
jgi:hypothetical protein